MLWFLPTLSSHHFYTIYLLTDTSFGSIYGKLNLNFVSKSLFLLFSFPNMLSPQIFTWHIPCYDFASTQTSPTQRDLIENAVYIPLVQSLSTHCYFLLLHSNF